MIVEHSIIKDVNAKTTSIKFTFTLEEDDRLVVEGDGTRNIKLNEKTASFDFPLILDEPHSDLLALASLKIISPYVGNKITFAKDVSEKFAENIFKAYPHIKQVNFNKNVKPREKPLYEKPVVSFSGGLDSVAVAMLLDKDVPLILSARKYHPNIGEFEKWYKTEANVKTLESMPNSINKYTVYTDFEFLSISTKGNYCSYPDTYSFTIPSILLADYFKTSHIITGDIWVAFTGDETIYNKDLSYRRRYLYKSVGLDIESLINGVGELGSLWIAKNYGVDDIATTCQYGDFKKPCMKCIKCFRKSIYRWAIFNEKLTDKQLEVFNSSPAVQNFSNNSGRGGKHFMPSFNYCFRRINYSFELFPYIQAIYDRAMSINIDTDFVGKIYFPAYETVRPYFVHNGYKKLLNIMPKMNLNDIEEFTEINYKNNFKENK